jgi:hypothetical protein
MTNTTVLERTATQNSGADLANAQLQRDADYAAVLAGRAPETAANLSTSRTTTLASSDRDAVLRTAAAEREATVENQPSHQAELDVRRLQSDVDSMVQKLLRDNVPASELQARMREDFAALWKQYGEHFGRELWQETVDRYQKGLTEGRERQMLEEARKLAEQSAAQDFARDHQSQPDLDAVQRNLNSLAEKYGDLFTAERIDALRQNLVQSYESTYTAVREQKEQQRWDSLAWYEKAWEGVSNWAGSAWQGMKNIASGIGAVAQTVGGLAVDAVRGIGSLAQSAAGAVADVAVGAWNLATSAETYKSIWNGVTATASAIGSGISSAATAIADAASFCWNNPDKVWSAIQTGATAAWNGITTAAEYAWKAAGATVNALAEFGAAVINDPAKAWEMLKSAAATTWEGAKTAALATGRFVYGMAETLGIVGFCQGIRTAAVETWNTAKAAASTAMELGRDFARLARGEITAEELAANFKQNVGEIGAHYVAAWKGVGSAALSLGKGVCEFTGVADMYRAGVAIANGDWVSASMHLTFAAGSVAGLFTLGASNIAVLGAKQATKEAVKQVLKQSAKEGFELLAKEVGEQALSNLAKESVEALAKQTLKEAGQEVTKEAVEAAGKQILKQAGVESLENASKESLEAVLKVTLERSGAQAATNAAEVMTKELAEMSAERLAALRASAELTEDFARQIAKTETEKIAADLVRNPAKQAVSEMLERIEKSSAKDLAQELGIEKKAAKEMQRALARGKADDEIKQILEEQLVRDLKDPVANGMRESFEKTMEGRAKEISKAFDLDEAALRKGAREGFEEGVEAGVRRGAREGIEESFREFRGRVRPAAGPGGVAERREIVGARRSEASEYEGTTFRFEDYRGSDFELRRGKIEEPVIRQDELNLDGPVKKKAADVEVPAGTILQGPGSQNRKAA